MSVKWTARYVSILHNNIYLYFHQIGQRSIEKIWNKIKLYMYKQIKCTISSDSDSKEVGLFFSHFALTVNSRGNV